MPLVKFLSSFYNYTQTSAAITPSRPLEKEKWDNIAQGNLSSEIIEYIFSYLTATQLGIIESVCKHWNLCSTRCWKHLCIKEGIGLSASGNVDFKKLWLAEKRYCLSKPVRLSSPTRLSTFSPMNKPDAIHVKGNASFIFFQNEICKLDLITKKLQSVSIKDVKYINCTLLDENRIAAFKIPYNEILFFNFQNACLTPVTLQIPQKLKIGVVRATKLSHDELCLFDSTFIFKFDLSGKASELISTKIGIEDVCVLGTTIIYANKKELYLFDSMKIHDGPYPLVNDAEEIKMIKSLRLSALGETKLIAVLDIMEDRVILPTKGRAIIWDNETKQTLRTISFSGSCARIHSISTKYLFMTQWKKQLKGQFLINNSEEILLSHNVSSAFLSISRGDSLYTVELQSIFQNMYVFNEYKFLT